VHRSRDAFETLDEARDKLDTLIEDFGIEAVDTEKADLEAKLFEAEARVADLEAKNTRLTTDLGEARKATEKTDAALSETSEKLKRAVSIGLAEAKGRELAEAKTDAMHKLLGRADAPKMLALVEDCETAEAVERVFVEHPERVLTEDIKARIRARVGRGVETATPLEEESPSHGAEVVVLPGMSVDVGEFANLAGLND
jgi:hypothetical protein